MIYARVIEDAETAAPELALEGVNREHFQRRAWTLASLLGFTVSNIRPNKPAVAHLSPSISSAASIIDLLLLLRDVHHNISSF
jgi:hypothetical protein